MIDWLNTIDTQVFLGTHGEHFHTILRHLMEIQKFSIRFLFRAVQLRQADNIIN